MKQILLLAITILYTSLTFAQDISGSWTGTLKPGSTALRIVFNISKTDKGLSATMDSPDQGAKGIAVSTVGFEASQLTLSIPNLKIEYSGTLKDGSLTGTFKQGGFQMPLDLTRGSRMLPQRPQEPANPYPYYSEEVIIKNSKANISLVGTLTMPDKEGNYPAVILISGSGPQNRDEELFGHKPFLILADHLTRNGIAVLRYDDRGIEKSEGDFKNATIADFVTDAESALVYLKTRREINKKKIGLIGHSEGGIIAPEIAAKSADVGFMVLLAAPGIPGYELLLLQKEKIERQMNVPEAAVLSNQKLFKGAYEIIMGSPLNDPTLPAKISSYLKTTIGNQASENQISAAIKQLTNPYIISLIKYDPAPILKKINIPVLALNGAKDIQVPAQENLAGLKNLLTRNLTTKEYPTLNHLFQTCKSCSITEYQEIEETFSPQVLNDISEWIKGLND